MKQSQQYYLPTINEATKFADFLAGDHKQKKFIAHCEDNEKQFLKDCLDSQESAIVLIGPEGDFSTTEISQALSAQFIPISLGSTRLRTETAAVVASLEVNLLNR